MTALLRAAGLVIAAACVAGCDGCGPASRPSRADDAPSTVLAVPRAPGPIAADGEVDEAAWMSAGRTGPFHDRAGALARPSSEARLLWDATNLYLVLYAGDEESALQ